MGKPQSGFRLGNFAWLGSYSECMNLTEAQYCLAGVKITIPPGNQVSVLWLISMLITYRSAFDLFNPLWCWYVVTNLQGKFLLSKICLPAGSAKHSLWRERHSLEAARFASVSREAQMRHKSSPSREPTCSPQIGWYTYLWRNISLLRACTSCFVVFVTAGPFLNRNLFYIQLLLTRLY